MSINSNLLAEYLFEYNDKEKEINEMLEELYKEPKNDLSFHKLILLLKYNYKNLYNYWRLKIL